MSSRGRAAAGRVEPPPLLGWRSLGRPARAFDRRLLDGPAAIAARALLGARLVSTVDGERTVGVVVETEAYLGPEDPASHAATRSGVTPRNRAMFGPPGRAYVYRSYGVHWCLNVVVGPVGHAGAVLVRGLDPIEGVRVMQRRRGRADLLASGPGRLCEALGVTGALYGHDLARPPLRLLGGWAVPAKGVVVSGRIGVKRAADWPLRFQVRERPGASR